jgi:hypothetical protein
MLCTGSNSRSTGHPRLGGAASRIAFGLAIGLTCLVESTAALSEDQAISPGFEKCKVIADDQARLVCLKGLLPQNQSDTSSAPESWHLVRTPNPRGGPDAVSMMRTADTSKSDPDLAGLMIRCDEKRGVEASIALVRPVPPRSKRDVVISWGTTHPLFHAEASPLGTALILPIDVAVFARDAWRDQQELGLTIQDPEGDVRGAIPIDGLGEAVARLSANCPK